MSDLDTDQHTPVLACLHAAPTATVQLPPAVSTQPSTACAVLQSNPPVSTQPSTACTILQSTPAVSTQLPHTFSHPTAAQQFAAVPACAPVPCPTGSGTPVDQHLYNLAQQDPSMLSKAVDHLPSVSKQAASFSALLLEPNELHPSVLLAALALDRLKKSDARTAHAVTLNQAALTDITCRIPTAFTLDCSAVSVPSLLNVPALSSAPEVLNTALSGHIYMHAPSSCMSKLVQHYHACKTTASDLSGVFVVTQDMYRRHPDLFKTMQTLQTYPKNSPINLKHYKSSPPTIARSNTKLLVLYDGPVLPTSTSIPTATPSADETPLPPTLYNPPPLSSVFSGLISGTKATIGIDNMCQGYGFIHPNFVERHNLKTVPIQHLRVQLGDGNSTTSTNLACKVHVKLGSYTATTWLLVMNIPGSYDALLGDQFLVSHNAYCVPDRKCLIVQHPSRKHVIYNQEATQLKKAQNRTPTILLSAIKILKHIRKSVDYTLCFVQLDQPSSTPEEPSIPHDLTKYPPEIANLIRKYPTVFPANLTVQPLRPDMPVVINTIPTATPPNLPTYRHAPFEQAEIEKQIQDLLAQNLIHPSTSPYGAPVLLVKKKDGTMRMCIDYRALNHITIKNAYPLPRIDDLLDKIQGAKFFSSLDLLSGYHQLSLQPSDVPKTAFKTHVGLFEYKVLSFGLTNAPSVFQSVMNNVFSKHNMLNKFVLVYMDDILILSKTFEEHLQHLDKVFSVLQSEGLSVKLKKCQFFQDELKFLGHVISPDGIKPDPDKIKTVDEYPLPQTQTELKGFLGLTNYFRRFIKNYASIVAPLNKHTSKATGKTVLLDDEAIHAFHSIKDLLKTATLLAIPDFSKPFKLITDASQIGLGGILIQDGRPIAYESKKFNTAEMNYSTPDRELLAVVHCLKKWKVYMLHNPANEIVTDHKPNITIHTKSPDSLSPRQVRWIEFLQQFPCKWTYEKGETNIADPLSRFNTYLLSVLQVDSQPEFFNNGTLQLPKLLHSISLLSATDPYITTSNLPSENGIYFFRDRIYVPASHDLRKQLISLHHDTVYSGHMGKNHTLQNLQRWFYWPNMHHDVATYVRHCHTCQTAKPGLTSRHGLLQPLPVPDRPWWSISLDFITGLPPTQDGFDAILTIVDRTDSSCSLGTHYYHL